VNCPECGTVMNRHAEKVVVPRTPAEVAAVDAWLDGVLVAEYACPVCGASAEQLVSPPDADR
jgi:ribosomal protein S27AE